jgi:hypothetical protein
VPTGSYEPTVTGKESGFPLSGQVTVSGFSPVITATAAVKPGETVEVDGSGYAPEEQVTLTFAATKRTVQADEGGASQPTPSTATPPAPSPSKHKAQRKEKTKTTLKVSEMRLAGGKKEVVTVTVSPSSAASP